MECSDDRAQIPVIKEESVSESFEDDPDYKTYDVKIKNEAVDIKDEVVGWEEMSPESPIKEIKVDKYEVDDASIPDTKHKARTLKRVNSKVKIHKCCVCTYETNFKGNLKKHMVVHKHPSEVEMHKCAKCSFQTKYKSNLKNHTLMHENLSKAEMHYCRKCSFQTKYKYALTNHVLLHKETRLESIDTYDTKHVINLKCHIRDHNDT